VEEAYGLNKAVEIDASVWSKIGKINALRLQKAFDLGQGIRALIKAIGLDPLWLFFGYEVEQISMSEAVMRFTDCLAQKGRLKMGIGILECF